MRNRLWILIIVLIGFVLFAVAVGALFYFFFRKPVEVSRGTVVEVTLKDQMYEFPSESPLAQIFRPGHNLWDLGRVFKFAAKDDRVAGIYLEIQPLFMSWGQIEELRSYMHDFRKSRKPIHVLLAVDMLGEDELYLASAADSITLNPDAGIMVNGLMAEITFFKRTLDKLGIEPQFMQFKEFKSPEQFTRESMAPEIRAMLESILLDVQDRFVTTVARERKIGESIIRQAISRGISPADAALQQKLVDVLGYKDQIQEKFKVSEKGEKRYRGLSAAKYLEAAKGKFKSRTKHKVALVAGEGAILATDSDPFGGFMGGTTVSSRLAEIRRDKGIKGVIFRVDSPGGSAVGSDMIWREVELLQKAKKPVVVSMSGVAGSGGYYISMGADKILSQPSTITGSIGVIFGKFNVTGFYNWLGVTIDRVEIAPNADIFSEFTSLTDEQKQEIESWMRTIYDNFVKKAAEGRKTTYQDLEPKAHGRIYTGAQAKAIGLVDDLGGLTEAVREMKKALKIPEREEIELVLYPKPKTLWQALTEGDLVSANQYRPLLVEWLERELKLLTTPAPWMLMPEIRIY